METDQDDFKVPEDFSIFSKKYFELEDPGARDFLELCKFAIESSKVNWEYRDGLAYHVTGAWIRNKAVENDKALYDIGARFGQLETPMQHSIFKSEEDVKAEWASLERQVNEEITKLNA